MAHIVTDATRGSLSGLAIEGGPKTRNTPLPPWPHYTAEEIDAAARILQSGRVNYWTGTEGRNFEKEFAAWHGVNHGLALGNGTLALEQALRVLGIGDGDEVIVTPRSYFASASCVVLAGATPVFAEIDRDSQNITAATIEPLITPRTKAIIPVHLAGWPCDMPAIMELANANGLKVIEDCAQAHGAKINGQPVGSFGHMAAFSFCQDKIMTTAGEGGMLITDDPALWEAGWSFKDHGKSYARVHADDHPPGFRWLHEGFGSNWRMTEIQCAIGSIQLRRLDDWVTARNRNAARLRDGLEDLSVLRIPQPPANMHHAYYKFYAFLETERLAPGWDQLRILNALQAEGVPGLSGSCPEIYREKAFADRRIETLPVAHELGKTSIMFPVHPTLNASDIDDLISAARKVLTAASG